MRIGVSWLREHVDLPADLTPAVLEEALIGLGIGTLLAPGLTGFVNYDAEVASTDSIQAVRGGLRYNF